MSNRKLWLLVGHHRRGIYSYPHLRDPGAILKDHKGKEITNEHYEAEKIVMPAYQRLKGMGYDVELCPFSYNLQGKIIWANRADKNDFVISVHLNSFTDTVAKGTEVFYKGKDKSSRVRATRLAAILSRTMELKHRGRKADTTTGHGRLAIVRDVPCDAFLFEMGFLSNSYDLDQVRKYGVDALVKCGKYLLEQ